MSSRITTTTISTVIFDLGNVVLLFDHWRVCRRVAMRYGLAEQFVFQQIFESGLEKAFDEGSLSPELFTDECSKALSVELSIAVWREMWSDIFWKNEPVIQLVHELKPAVRLVLLSNTNTWHIEQVREKFSVLELFDKVVLSFEVGHTKPHERIFERAIEVSAEPLNPARSAFIDDREDYVRAGEKLGLRGIHYTNVPHLRKQLKNLGVV